MPRAARDLAKRHSANVILVARRRERLLELQIELETKATCKPKQPSS